MMKMYDLQSYCLTFQTAFYKINGFELSEGMHVLMHTAITYSELSPLKRGMRVLGNTFGMYNSYTCSTPWTLASRGFNTYCQSGKESCPACICPSMVIGDLALNMVLGLTRLILRAQIIPVVVPTQN